MYYTFETQKALEAAAVLLRAHHCRMSYLRLLKLLYIADRESYRIAARPIVGNHPVEMDNGPLNSEVYNLIKGAHDQQHRWSKYIRRDGFEVELLDDPNVLHLSEHEVRVLDAVADQYRSQDDWEIVALTHGFPEWKKNKQAGSSAPIPIEDILEAVGFEPDDRRTILGEIEEERELERNHLRYAKHTAGEN